ncbi:MAG: sulfotransferase family protein [Phycisphaeraceae bacterium]
MTQSPVFIVGEARSGTSIAHRCMLLHPVFALSDPERSGLAESNAFVNPLKILDDFAGTGLAEYLLNDTEQIGKLHSEVDQYRGSAKRFWKIFRMAKKTGLPAKLIWKAGKYTDILHAYFDVAMQVRGQKRLLEKSPDHNWHIPEILWTYPQAKIIYLTRNPVDTYASYHKRYQREKKLGKSEQELQWLKPSIQDITARLKNNWQRVADAHGKWPNNVLTVRYEDFVGDYENVMRSLLTWLGAEVIIHEPEDSGKNWGADPQLMSGLRKKTDSNEGVMTQDEVDQVETLMKSSEGVLSASMLQY